MNTERCKKNEKLSHFRGPRALIGAAVVMTILYICYDDLECWNRLD